VPLRHAGLHAHAGAARSVAVPLAIRASVPRVVAHGRDRRGCGHTAGLAQRIDRIACGDTVVIAHAYCYEDTGDCIRETLTFHRPENRAVLAPHKHMVPQLLPDGSTVEGLDY